MAQHHILTPQGLHSFPAAALHWHGSETRRSAHKENSSCVVTQNRLLHAKQLGPNRCYLFVLHYREKRKGGEREGCWHGWCIDVCQWSTHRHRKTRNVCHDVTVYTKYHISYFIRAQAGQSPMRNSNISYKSIAFVETLPLSKTHTHKSLGSANWLNSASSNLCKVNTFVCVFHLQLMKLVGS